MAMDQNVNDTQTTHRRTRCLNATPNEDNEDTPETLAEQERLLAAVTAAEALTSARCRPKRSSPTSRSARRASTWRKGYPRLRSSPRSRRCRRSSRPRLNPRRRLSRRPLPSSPLPHTQPRMASTRANSGRSSAPLDCALPTPWSKYKRAGMSGIIDTGMTTRAELQEAGFTILEEVGAEGFASGARNEVAAIAQQDPALFERVVEFGS